jgi:hypothetical protein
MARAGIHRDSLGAILYRQSSVPTPAQIAVSINMSDRDASLGLLGPESRLDTRI